MGKGESAASEGGRWKFQSSKPSTPSKRAAAKAGYRRDNLHHEPPAPDPPPAPLRQAGGARAPPGRPLPREGPTPARTDPGRPKKGVRPPPPSAPPPGKQPPSPPG